MALSHEAAHSGDVRSWWWYLAWLLGAFRLPSPGGCFLFCKVAVREGFLVLSCKNNSNFKWRLASTSHSQMHECKSDLWFWDVTLSCIRDSLLGTKASSFQLSHWVMKILLLKSSFWSVWERLWSSTFQIWLNFSYMSSPVLLICCAVWRSSAFLSAAAPLADEASSAKEALAPSKAGRTSKRPTFLQYAHRVKVTVLVWRGSNPPPYGLNANESRSRRFRWQLCPRLIKK